MSWKVRKCTCSAGPPILGRWSINSVPAYSGKYLSFPDSHGNDIRATKNLRYAPKWNFSLGGELTIPVGDGDNRFQIGSNIKYLDDYATEGNKDVDGPIFLGCRREIITAHTSVDASVSYFGNFDGADYKLSAFVTDAFDDGGRIVRSSQAGRSGSATERQTAPGAGTSTGILIDDVSSNRTMPVPFGTGIFVCAGRKEY